MMASAVTEGAVRDNVAPGQTGFVNGGGSHGWRGGKPILPATRTACRHIALVGIVPVDLDPSLAPPDTIAVKVDEMLDLVAEDYAAKASARCPEHPILAKACPGLLSGGRSRG